MIVIDHDARFRFAPENTGTGKNLHAQAIATTNARTASRCFNIHPVSFLQILSKTETSP
jgi:hypothetical protein